MPAEPPGRYVGQPIRRREDVRHLSGRSCFIADIRRPGLLHMAVLRSPYAHARLLKVDTTEADRLTGVVATLCAKDLGSALRPLPLYAPHPNLTAFTPLPLADKKVRYVGEPVGIVVARSRERAEEALEAIRVEYDPLPSAIDPIRALDSKSVLLYEEHTSNLAAHIVVEKGDVRTAIAQADNVVIETLAIGRVAAGPLETRGIVAEYDTRPGGGLTVWDSTQSVHMVRRILASTLEMPEHLIRVIAPDVGGGFGSKNRFYPEEFLVAFLARKLREPVAWISSRREDFLATYQERDQTYEAEIAVKHDGTILGLRVRCWNDCGAYVPLGVAVPHMTLLSLPGPYRIPNYRGEGLCVYTNKPPMAPVRGGGRPQATFVMERLLDRAAAKLGLDRAEIRQRNLITAQEQPYNTQIRAQDGRFIKYDGGDYPAALDKALQAIGYHDVRQVHHDERFSKRPIGVGIACYLEMAGSGPFEGARIEIDGEGNVVVFTGVSSQGQGLETTLAQVCAERLGVSMERVLVVLGDTQGISHGVGTFGSRTAVTAANAVAAAAQQLREKALNIASRALEVPVHDLEFAGDAIRLKHSPSQLVNLRDLAQLSDYPNLSHHRLYGLDTVEETGPGLEATVYYRPEPTFAYGVHAAIVEVDAESGLFRVLKYVIVHDCGNVINPVIVDGQVIGGMVHGLGGAVSEQIIFDATGQPLITSFLDYALPRASNVPQVEIMHMHTPSNNPEGVKGTAEGGVMPVAAVLCSAIEDALRPLDIWLNQIPIRPALLWRSISTASGRQS